MKQITVNPFVGIRPFESDESLLFFGRQEQTMELLQRLHQFHFVAVTGGSGSGKSSLVRAGLIPGLKAGYLVNDRDRWRIAIMKPGQSPLANLAEAVLAQLSDNTTPAAEVVEGIKEKGADAILELLAPLWGANTNFFLLVDQFEELFRFSMENENLDKKNEATDFVNILLTLSSRKDLPIYVVITMRSDFVGDCANFYGLPEAMNQSQYIVPRLNRLQLKSTIEGPVKLYNGVINPSLTARLLNDVQVVKDELPLLQHALMRIWDYEMNVDKNGELDLNDYEKIGGIEKALSNHADEALQGMSDKELGLTKRIFQALTVVDDRGRKVRRPVRLTELEAITGATRNEIQFIITRFIEGNRAFLIVSKLDGGDSLIDISHESLIRQWSTLNGWVDEEAESGKTFLRLTESAALYNQNKKDLLMGNELQPILLWYQTFQPGPVWAKRYNADYQNSFAYLEQSKAAWKEELHKKEQRKKNLRAVLFSIIGLAFLLLGWFYFHEKQLKNSAIAASEVAKENEDKALQAKESLQQALTFERSKSKGVIDRYHQLTTTIKDQILDSLRFHDSLHIDRVITKVNTVYTDNSAEKIRGLVARQNAQDGEALQLMQQALKEVTTNPTTALRLAEVAMQKVGYRNNSIYSLANKMYRENAFYKTVHDYKVCPLFHSVSSDGTKVLTVFPDKVNLLQLATGESTEFKNIPKNIYSIEFSPDGKEILAGTARGSAVLWDTEGNVKKTFFIPDDSGIIRSVSFSPSGQSLALVSEQSGLHLFQIGGDLIRTLDTKTAFSNSVTFSPDGDKLLITFKNAPPELWNVQGKRLKKFDEMNGRIYSVAFSPDGNKIATGYSNGIIKLWDKNGFLLQEFREKKSNSIISSIVFAKDGTRLLTASQDGIAKLWHVNGYIIREFKGEMTNLLCVAFSPDEKKVYTGSLDGSVRQWDISGAFDRYNGKYTPTVGLTTFLEGNKMLDLLTNRQKEKYGIQ